MFSGSLFSFRMIVFSILRTFSRMNQSGCNCSRTFMPGRIKRLRSSSSGRLPERMAAEIRPAPLEDIPWQGGDKVRSQGLRLLSFDLKCRTYASCSFQTSPSNTLVSGKLLLIRAAREGMSSQAARTGTLAPHSIPTSPTPPPEKREPETRETPSSSFRTFNENLFLSCFEPS